MYLLLIIKIKSQGDSRYMGTIIFLSVITVLVLVGIVLSIVLIKKSKNSDSGIISDKLGIYEKKLEIYEKNLKDEICIKS